MPRQATAPTAECAEVFKRVYSPQRILLDLAPIHDKVAHKCGFSSQACRGQGPPGWRGPLPADQV